MKKRALAMSNNTEAIVNVFHTKDLTYKNLQLMILSLLLAFI